MLGEAMRTGEQFLLTYPVYVVKQSATRAVGFVQGDVAGLALFSDFNSTVRIR